MSTVHLPYIDSSYWLQDMLLITVLTGWLISLGQTQVSYAIFLKTLTKLSFIILRGKRTAGQFWLSGWCFQDWRQVEVGISLVCIHHCLWPLSFTNLVYFWDNCRYFKHSKELYGALSMKGNFLKPTLSVANDKDNIMSSDTTTYTGTAGK